MSIFDKPFGRRESTTSKPSSLNREPRGSSTGKAIYSQHQQFEWNSNFVERHQLEPRRIQSNGLDQDALGDTISLIKLEEDAPLESGYNPYNSGSPAAKRTRSVDRDSDTPPLRPSQRR